MDVRLPSGVLLRGVPEGTSKDEIKRKAIAAGLATEADFGVQEPAPQQMTGEVPVLPEQQAMVPQEPVQAAPERTIGERVMGGLEAAAATTIGGIPAMIGQGVGAAQGAVEYLGRGDFSKPPADLVQQRAMEGAQRLSVTPPSEAGREYVQAVGEALAPLGGSMAGLAPVSTGVGRALTSGAKQAAPVAMRAATVADDFASSAASKIKSSIERRKPSTYGQGQSGGAAATPEAMQRIATAESLPVPVKLTKGAALREAEQLAFEKEQMKTAFGGPLRDRIEENNLQILQNFDEMVDRTGAQALFSGPTETGSSVVKALSQGMREARAKTKAAYDIANASDEAKAIANPSEFFQYIDKQVTGSPSVAIVDYMRSFMKKNEIQPGRMTVKQLEELRQEINKNVTADPANYRHAAIMKQLIDDATNEVAGPLYKRARSRRMQEANVFENRAIVARLLETKKGGKDPKVPLDKVFDKTILGSSPREINYIKRVLNAHGEAGKQAWSDLQGTTVDYIRAEATKNVGTDSAGNPLVSPALLNRVVNTLDSNGRLDVIFGQRQAQAIRDLNDVVKYVNTVPPGTLINSSGTTATLLAAMGEMGVTGAFTGLPVPVIATLKVLRDKVKERALKRKIQDTLDYAAKVSNGENK